MSEAAQQIKSERLHQLNVIKRFLQSPQSLILLVGERESGKTQLLDDVITQMRASRMIIRLQATPNLTPSQLAEAISKHWAIKNADKAARIETQLDKMLEGLTKHSQQCILVIDDAHLLSLSVLAAISHLATQQDGKAIHLHILLTGRPILSEKMGSLQTKEVPRLTIGGLSREACFRKIKRMLDDAGLYLPHAAANAVFTKLYHRSQGMPETLESMVNKLIVQRSMGDQSVAEKLETSESVPVRVKKSFSLPSLSLPDFRQFFEGFWNAHRIKTISIVGLAVVGSLFWAWQHHRIQLPALPTPIAKTHHVVKHEHHAAKPKHHVTKHHAVAAKHHTTQHHVTKHKAITAARSALPEPTRATKPVTTKPRYVLQVMGGTNPRALKRYADSHRLGNTRIMRTIYNGHSWHVLTYGEYRSFNEAKAAIPSMPAVLRARQPWVRSTKYLSKVRR